MRISTISIIEIFISLFFVLFIYFKYIKKGDYSKKYFFYLSISFFFIYCAGAIRMYLPDVFLSSLIWKFQYICFMGASVSVLLSIAHIMNFSKKFNYFIVIFSILAFIGILMSNDYVIVGEEIKFINSTLLDFVFILDLILLIIVILIFFSFGVKNKNINAILFSIGSFMLITATILHVKLINPIYKYLSIPALLLIILSFIVKTKNKKQD